MKFGVELEVISRDNKGLIAGKLLAEGIDCEVEGYNHRTRPHWKIVTDASIDSHTPRCPHEFEVVSPILYGESGLLEAMRVADILNQNGCDANKTCGLHVHIDAEDLEAKQIANITRAWIRNEWVVDSLIPKSRRANNNHYCKSVLDPEKEYTREYEGFLFSALDRAERSGRDGIISEVNPGYSEDDRFFKLNLTALRRHNTVEFRYHSGTVQSEKIKRQVQFCYAFVTKYAEKKLRTTNHASNTNYRWGLNKSTNRVLNDLVKVLPEGERKDFRNYWKGRQSSLAA